MNICLIKELTQRHCARFTKNLKPRFLLVRTNCMEITKNLRLNIVSEMTSSSQSKCFFWISHVSNETVQTEYLQNTVKKFF